MSGIAGIIHFDGRPVEPGQIEAMTGAMHYRGPDGINHWRKGNVALGQCMLRTTPESLEETQPLTNEDESLVLVMDGRVDNVEELRRELLGRGAILRTRTDAELVLRAYEIWGEGCPDRIIGECVFFIWDARQQRLFAARDAAGTRHFYYHQGTKYFAFASEVKGLLTLPIKRRLNESRLLDYLVPEFDRDDEVSTFYQDVLRMPAGHSMVISENGIRLWRYWNPCNLTENKFTSLQDCTEGFMDQLRAAVKCRLRSIKPVAALLSGGLDSSAIVGLIGKEFRGDLMEPLHSISLIRADSIHCLDWKNIKEILARDEWLRPTIITTDAIESVWQSFLDGISQTDDPFVIDYGLLTNLTCEIARMNGCGVLFEGMAGDFLFYNIPRTIATLVMLGRYGDIPTALAASRRHGQANGRANVLRATLSKYSSNFLWGVMRSLRDERSLSRGDMKILRRDVARRFLTSKRPASYRAGKRLELRNGQKVHANDFMGGLLSFSHEVGSAVALAKGLEHRSPFSDRRIIEYAVRMPSDAKFAVPWYKHVLRNGTEGFLPDGVRWRLDLVGNPSWTYYERTVSMISMAQVDGWSGAACSRALERWCDDSQIKEIWDNIDRGGNFGERAYRIYVLAKWLDSHGF